MSFYVDGDEENLPRLERLRILAGGASSLTPFVRGFQDGGFLAELRQFVAARAAEFKSVCVDGSHPLAWTQYHNEYREMFERHFDAILASLAMSREEAQQYFHWLHQSATFLDDDSEDLFTCLDTLTASEDFQEFLQVMFAEVRRQEAEAARAASGGVAWRRIEIEEVEEIEVTVPVGVSAGQTLPVQYLGLPYKVVVPVGVGPGMVFSAEITLHKNCEHAFVCAYCGSKFDKAVSGRDISKCSRCYERCRRDVCYCNAACQRADWPQHKPTCGKNVEVDLAA